MIGLQAECNELGINITITPLNFNATADFPPNWSSAAWQRLVARGLPNVFAGNAPKFDVR